ncbi:hypothetical protein PF008_g24594 [Phytophthora fragariae]|uniref:Uncharacterized protein n=1 Tax=Phytophthora fragariae TaxID=53985 RepID=A0A6G0QMF9_9STRA|nr:hypothetical protein PF008_g24594 [Phytophthora fragariae]
MKSTSKCPAFLCASGSSIWAFGGCSGCDDWKPTRSAIASRENRLGPRVHFAEI